ncbi:MAG: ABC transporter permease [Ardenticatenaceae bacterium]|nr:ABC transporter permease [Ardenticatenaceae bacterium]
MFFVLVALLGPWIAPQDPYAIHPARRLEPPSANHPFGTDEVGRDVFSRLIWGARLSIGVSLLVTITSVVLGIAIGLVAGVIGGFLDELIMRLTDIFLAVPLFILAMAVTAALGPSMTNAAIAMVIVWWPGYARQTRAQVLDVKKVLYVEAARSIGANAFHISIQHILPNCLDPIFVRASMTTGYIILNMAGLSFIGLGSQPPTAEWGTMIALARTFLLSHPWYPLLTGLPLFFTVLTFALAGDAIQDALDVRAE